MKKNFKYIFIFALLLVAVLVWREVWARDGGILKFYVLDVGQGDAIFIETPSGNQILIDGGPDKSVLKELGEVMPFYDRTIDLVILTHPHLDHAGGLTEVFKNYQVLKYMDSGEPDTLAEYRELKKTVEAEKIPYLEARRGMKIILDENAVLNILTPEKLLPGSSEHRNMVISRLSFGEVDFLLTGDAERPLEFFLVEKGDEIGSEVLKAGHHGSRTSSNLLFLEKVAPEYALISAGLKNKYGHPHREVLENLDKIGAKILRTDLDGRILLETDGLRIF